MDTPFPMQSSVSVPGGDALLLSFVFLYCTWMDKDIEEQKERYSL